MLFIQKYILREKASLKLSLLQAYTHCFEKKLARRTIVSSRDRPLTSKENKSKKF